MISPQGYKLGAAPDSQNPFWGDGEDSDVNKIFATATVDEGTGVPSVTTTKQISGNDITFGFNFHNLKGERGSQGPAGATGATGPAGPAGAAGAAGAAAAGAAPEIRSVWPGKMIDDQPRPLAVNTDWMLTPCREAIPLIVSPRLTV